MNLKIEYNNYKLGFWPVEFFQCVIQDGALKSYGYAIERSKGLAKLKSFNEAVERLSFKRLSKEKKYSSTTGFAAAENLNEAIVYAKQELIERELLKRAWAFRRGWHQISRKNLLNKILITLLRLHGWEVSLYEVQSHFKKHTVLCGLAIHKNFGAVFDSSYFCGSYTEDKIINSLIRQIYFFKPSNNVEFAEIGTPQDHKSFYANPKNLSAFDFLKSSEQEAQIELDHVDEIQVEIHSNEKMPVIAIASNSFWNSFSWGRQSIFGANPYPHPLA